MYIFYILTTTCNGQLSTVFCVKILVLYLHLSVVPWTRAHTEIWHCLQFSKYFRIFHKNYIMTKIYDGHTFRPLYVKLSALYLFSVGRTVDLSPSLLAVKKNILAWRMFRPIRSPMAKKCHEIFKQFSTFWHKVQIYTTSTFVVSSI